MSFDTYWRFLLALLFVVALIAGCAWVARRFGFATRFGAAAGKRRLAIIEVLPLDGRRRLVLLGLHNDLVIERGQAGDFSGMVEDGRA